MKSINNRKIRLIPVTLFCLCLLFSVIGKANDTPSLFSGWQTVGPSGGDVRSIAIDPKDKNHLFISTLDGQVYTSPDAGNTWKFLVNFNRPLLVLDDLVVDSRDSKVIYTSGFRGVKDPGGFFKSTDGGLTWKEAKELKNEAIHAMVQSSLDPNILLVGSINGVFISKDSGDSWQKIEPESPAKPTDVDSLAVDPKDTNIIYAGTFWRPYKTTDGGKNWKLISTGMIDDSDVFTMDIDPRNRENIFASACSGIYFSANKGENWVKVNGIPSTSRRTRDLLQHPTIPGTVYAATTEGFWMSQNNGKTWAIKTPKELEINSIAVHPDAPNRVYIATNNYGVMISNDGGNTFSINNGNFTSRYAMSITSDIEKPNRLYATTKNTATGGGFIFISDDDGVTWKPSTKNLSVIRVEAYSLLQDRKNPNTIYIGTNIGVYRSIDRGISWNPVNAPKPAPVRKAPVKGKATARRGTAKPAAKSPVKTPAPSVNETTAAAKPNNKIPVLTEKVISLVYTEDGKDGFLAATTNGLYRTYDLNAGWEKVPFGDGIDQQIIAIATGDSDTIWIGTALSGVIVSRDNGATWGKVSGVKSDSPISSIAVNPQNPAIVYVGTQQTLYMSRDTGKSWTRRGGGLPGGNFTSIIINPSNPNEIFVGSASEINGGVYQTTNGGDLWKRLDTKDNILPSRKIRTMAFDARNPNRIFAGTNSGGIFRIDRAPVMTADETGGRPRIAGN